MAVIGRPKGSKDKSPRKNYVLSPSAHHQRFVAPLKDGKHSVMYKEIIKRQELSLEQQEQLDLVRLDLWKQFQSPAMMLMSEYADFRTLVYAKQLKGEDPTSKDVRDCLRLLLDISKEVNRLTQVTADKRFEAFSKNFQGDDGDIIIDVEGKNGGGSGG